MQENRTISAAAPVTRGKPALMRKRIGSTTYEVAIHFSRKSKEDLNDKIVRLIKNDTDVRAGL